MDYTVESLANLVLEGRSKTDALRINVRGMGAVTGDFTAKEAKVVLESMGEITGRMVAQKLEVTVGEMGKASWTGDVELLDAEVNSMGVLDGKELKAKFVKMHIEEMGKAEVYPVQSLEVQIESMGKVTYYHTPERIEQTVSSMGSLHKKEGND